MKLSIVVIFYNMRREAPRTLYTLGPDYQQGVSAGDYEVIAIDNGSSEPLDPEMVAGFGPNFHYHYFETDSVSPVEAVNFGASLAQGDALALIVDGARMTTPGILSKSLQALEIHDQPFIGGIAFHLGPDIQPKTILTGYCQEVEDKLLSITNWRENGYQLFAIATIAPSSSGGYLYGQFLPECSWLCMPRATFLELDGFNTAFQSPGGGLCNHEFRNRALKVSGTQAVMLLGEGMFHQFHGGAITNSMPRQRPMRAFREEYKRIFGVNFSTRPHTDITYLGNVPEPARRYLQM